MARYFHKKVPIGEDAFSLNQHVLLRRLFHEGVRLVANPVEDTGAAESDLQDLVRDVSAALLGKEIEFGADTTPKCPNGIKIGESAIINETRMYDGLPPLLKFENWE